MSDLNNQSRLLTDDEATFIKAHTQQKDWSKITANLNIKGAGISIVRQVIYQQSAMTQNTSIVIEAIKAFAKKMKEAKQELENRHK